VSRHENKAYLNSGEYLELDRLSAMPPSPNLFTHPEAVIQTSPFHENNMTLWQYSFPEVTPGFANHAQNNPVAWPLLLVMNFGMEAILMDKSIKHCANSRKVVLFQ
jgi:hypothetical protein